MPNKEIFRFVQMRNLQRNRKKPDEREDDRTPDTDIKIPETELTYDVPQVTVLLNELERSPKLGHTAAERALQEVRENITYFHMFAQGTKRVRNQPHFDVKRLRKFMRNALMRANISEHRVEALLRVAQTGYVSLYILGHTRTEVISAAEDAIRGIEILRALKDESSTVSSLKSIAYAPVTINGYPRQQATISDEVVTDLKRSSLQDNPFNSLARKTARLIPYKGGMLQIKASSQSISSSAGTAGVPGTVGTPRKVSVGELILTEEIAVTYDWAEIAHIENVMQTESRSRFHELKTSNEESTFDESEVIETSTTELKTTEQYDLQESIASATSSQLSAGAATAFSASYGPISASGSAYVDASTSQQNSMSRATSYSKEIMELAAKELTNRVKSSRSTTNKVIVTERNRHAFQNTYGSGHVVGVYRYLNKRISTQTINYGARLMLEFIVPEPAANYVFQLANATPPNLVIEEPEPFLLTPSQMNENNYQNEMAKYGVQALPVPPQQTIKVPAEISVEGSDKTENYDIYNQNKNDPDYQEPYKAYSVGTLGVEVPDGYRVNKIQLTSAFVNTTNSTDNTVTEWIRISCDRSIKTLRNKDDVDDRRMVMSPTSIEGDLAIGWAAGVRYGVSVSVSVECERRDGAFESWQNTVWSEINNAYQSLKRAYDNQLSYAQNSQMSFEDSPLSNREIEHTELKRAAISMLTEQDFSMFGSISAQDPTYFDPHEAGLEGEYIRFFEDAIEWDAMAHEYYDYFWAGNDRWGTLLGYSSNDYEHEQFLKAGAARLIIPVRPDYEVAILNFLDNGDIWDGESKISLDQDHVLYQEIKTLIEEPRDERADIIGKEEIVVPTNLVILQNDANPNVTDFVGQIQTPPIVECDQQEVPSE